MNSVWLTRSQELRTYKNYRKNLSYNCYLPTNVNTLYSQQ